MRRWAIITAISLLLLVVLVAAALYLSNLDEDDDLSGLADFVEPITGNVARVARKLNPMSAARRQAVVDSLQAQIPSETSDRPGLIGSLLAILGNESGYNPEIFNYYDDQKKLRKGYGYDDPNFFRAHAAGIAQHVKKFWSERGLSAENVLDLDANVGACLNKLSLPDWRTIMSRIPEASLQLRAACLYMAHGRGRAALGPALDAAAAGQDWDAISEAVRLSPYKGGTLGTGGLRFAHMWTVAADAPSLAETYG